MAGSINKVILIGNLGKDPEVRHLESGVAVCNFSIATGETYKDRNSGEKVTHTEWHNIVLWRGLAEVAEKYLKKELESLAMPSPFVYPNPKLSKNANIPCSLLSSPS